MQWIGDTWAGTDYWAQQKRESCAYFFNRTTSLMDRTGGWHHLAVTWTADNEGTTKIYKDGLLMKTVGSFVFKVWGVNNGVLGFTNGDGVRISVDAEGCGRVGKLWRSAGEGRGLICRG